MIQGHECHDEAAQDVYGNDPSVAWPTSSAEGIGGTSTRSEVLSGCIARPYFPGPTRCAAALRNSLRICASDKEQGGCCLRADGIQCNARLDQSTFCDGYALIAAMKTAPHLS